MASGSAFQQAGSSAGTAGGAFSYENNPRAAAARALAGQEGGVHGGSGESEQSTVLSQAMGVIGGVIGAYFGGPQGAMAGYSAGTKVGSGVAKLGTNDGDAGMKDILGGGMEAVFAVIGSGGKKDAEVPGAQAAIQNRTGTRSINRASARIA